MYELSFPLLMSVSVLNQPPLQCRPPSWYRAPLAIGRLIFSSFLYTPLEKDGLARAQRYLNEQSGYLKVQSTRPQSLGFGLDDSPIGLLGWLVEKYHDWMDVAHYQMPDNEILAFVMMHWMQGATAGLGYYKAAFAEEGDSSMHQAFARYVDTPIGVSLFPKEIAALPRDWVAAIANVQFWREHDKGGHFPSVECPDELVKDLRDFFSLKVVTQTLAKSL